MMETCLSAGLSNLGIKDKHGELLKLLVLYIKELKMFNSAFNLVKFKDDNDLINSHILDSLAPWEFFAQETKEPNISNGDFFIADAGSGAGFPGIPLAALFLKMQTKIKFCLIERMEKRCAFLKNVTAVLNLNNTKVINTEAEKIRNKKFDIVTCRAFRPLNSEILHMFLNITKPGGKVFLYKATQEKVRPEIEVVQKAGLKFKIKKLSAPSAEKERCFLMIENQSSLQQSGLG